MILILMAFKRFHLTFIHYSRQSNDQFNQTPSDVSGLDFSEMERLAKESMDAMGPAV